MKFNKLRQLLRLHISVLSVRLLEKKRGKNAGEWTGKVEISKEEIPGSKRSMYVYILTYLRL